MGFITMSKLLKEMFSDSGGFASSKRGLGALCLIFAMIMGVVTLLISEPKDISTNVMTLLLALITAGTTLLGISVLEKK